MNAAEIHAIGDEFETRLRRVLESALKTLNESRFNGFISDDPTSESVTTTVSLSKTLSTE